jgi:CRP/FNR family transcriptional regulator
MAEDIGAMNRLKPGFFREFNRSTVLHTLKRCPLLADSSAEDLDAVVELSKVKTLAQGEYLFREGGLVRGFYVVRRGAVKVHRVNWLGKEQLIHLYRPFESLAEESLVSDLGHHADACAIEPTEVVLVRRAGFVALLQKRPELGLCLLRSTHRHVCRLVELLDDLTLKDVKTRIAKWLVDRCPDPQSSEPCSIELDTTKRVLAAELGTASETFSRALAKFRRQKLISTDGDLVTLHCPTRLARFVSQNRRHGSGPQPD